ncbi:MAG: BspA family leucine-rich repeat surface protein, partial [Bacteroidetes bacterium]
MKYCTLKQNNFNYFFTTLLLFFLYFSQGFAQITSTGAGSWNTPALWTGGIVPPPGANVVIASGHIVTLDVNTNNLGSLTVTGTLRLDAYNLNVTGATIVNGILDDNIAGGNSTFGGTFTVNVGGTVQSTGINTWYFGGNITNMGTFNLNSAVSYLFTNNLTITPTNSMVFGNAGGGGGQISAGTTVTIANAGGNVGMNGSSALNILGTLINNIQNPRTLTVNDMSGTGSFINGTNAFFRHGASAASTVSTFNCTASGNLVYYDSGSTQSIRASTYHHLNLGGGAVTKNLSGTTTVNGDLSVGITTTLGVGANTLNIGGNFTQNGTLSITGTINFFGGTNITTNVTNLPNLIINKSNANVTVTLSNSLTVSNSLILTQGRLQIGNNNLTYGGATSNLTYTNGWIETNGAGVLIRSLSNANLDFPVGNATKAQSIRLTNSAAGASVRFGSPTLLVPNSGIGSWFVNNTSPPSDVIFLNPQGNINPSSKVYVYTSVWNLTTTTYSSNNYTVTSALSGIPAEFSIYTSDLNPFITTWLADASGTITIPTTGGGYNYTATCTNITTGTIGNATVSGQTGNVTFSGLTSGNTYMVSITGIFPRIFFNNIGDITKIRTIEQWGNIAWGSMSGAFYGCASLQLNASDSPNLSAIGMNLSNMFQGCIAFTGNASMNNWNTSTVTNMRFMFANTSAFNQNIDAWNTSAVTNMQAMFSSAIAFNQNIGNWNTSAVTIMATMFFNAIVFNQNISSWNTGAVTTMSLMFNGADAFNQPIGSWNTSSVTNMSSMFIGNIIFNQNISSWNTSAVTDMNSMFSGATAFNQSLGTWQLRTAGVAMTNMLNNCGINTANYDATLIGWAGQAGAPTGVTLGATGRTYCIGFGARNTLLTTRGWTTITGDAVSGSCPVFSAVTATNVTSTSFRANWTGVGGATNYELSLSSDGGSTYNTINAPFVGNITSYNVTGLSPNTVYLYRVRSHDGSVYSGYSNIKMTSTILPAGSGNTLTFDGTAGKKINATNNSVYNFTNTNNFTLEAWVKINALGSQMHVISRTDGTTGYALFLQGSGQLGVIYNGTGSVSGTPLTVGKWTHIAAVFTSSGTFQTYIDGVATGSGGSIAITTNTHNLTIGLRTDNNFPFNGQIDEVSIWNTARLQPQIQASMCSKLTGIEAGLVGYFRLDENTGTVTENEAYNATTDGILVSSPTWATSTAPLGDVSANTYGGSSVTLTDTDVLTADDFSGTPIGVHIYKIKQAPNNVTAPANYASVYNSRYFGMFIVGGTNPKADLTYQYATNTQVVKPNSLRLARRNDQNFDWTQYGGVINRLQAKLVRQASTTGEYILAERNAITSNARNGGQMVLFNGTNQYAQTGNPIVGNDFTIEFWTKMPTNSIISGSNWHQGRPFVTMEASNSKSDYGITLLNNKFAFGTRDASGTPSTIQSTAVVAVDTWNHVAVTRNSTTGAIQLYVNGKLNASGTGATGTLAGGTLMNIAKNFASSIYWNGYIDEVRIWNTLLSDNTIKDMMNLRANDTHPNFQNLVSYYRFDEGTGIYTEDLQLGSDAQLFNSASWANADQPLGDGYVQRLNVTTPNSVQNFVNSGLQITFGNGIVPNGDIVVTRLETAPESYPNVVGMNFVSCYWVIRNYGTNTTFFRLDEMKFEVPANNTISAADLA